MVTKKLYIGSNDLRVAQAAKDYDPNAYLITKNNCAAPLQGTAYTSLVDIGSIKEFSNVLSQADIISYVPPTKWPPSQKELTENYLNYYHRFTNTIVENFYPAMLPQYTKLTVYRPSDISCLWAFGGSDTQGTGLADINQRYANIVAKEFGMDPVVLAANGASNRWAVDQLLRSDIKSGDIVILGITPHSRFPFYDPEIGDTRHVGTALYKKNKSFSKLVNIEFLSHDTLVYETVTAIYQARNFCKKIGATLVVAYLAGNFHLLNRLDPFDELIVLSKDWSMDYKDLCDDGMHPGPKTHQLYAEQLIKKIKS